MSRERLALGAACLVGSAAPLLAASMQPRILLIQWASWSPPLLTILLAASACFLLKRWARVICVLLLAASLWQCWQTTLAWRPSAPLPAESVSILHVNARHPGRSADDWARALGTADADIIVVTECGWLAGTELARAWREEGRTVVVRSNVLVASRWRCESAAVVPAGADSRAALFQMHHAEDGRQLHLCAVDLPSGLTALRWSVLEQLRVGLSAVEPNADVILGDFNTTPPAAVRALGNFDEAFAVAGRGIGATYPREFPLVRIDQCLVSPDWTVVSAATVDLGIGAHRAQFIVLTR